MVGWEVGPPGVHESQVKGSLTKNRLELSSSGEAGKLLASYNPTKLYWHVTELYWHVSSTLRLLLTDESLLTTTAARSKLLWPRMLYECL